MHRADKLHSCCNVVRALGSELCSGENIIPEKLQLVASQLVHVLAADAGRRLRQDLDGRAVDKAAFRLKSRAGEELLEAVMQKADQVLIHPAGLLAGAAQDSNLASRLEDAVQQRSRSG